MDMYEAQVISVQMCTQASKKACMSLMYESEQKFWQG